MFRILLAAIGVLFIAGVEAQDLKLPKFAPEDSWVYHKVGR
jgi:hypothetical protein